MPCPLHRILLLAVCALAGCETVAPFTLMSDYQVADLDLNDLDGQRSWVAEMMMLEISRTPRGSLVRVVDDRERQFLGTLIRADQKEVQLLLPLCKEVASSRHGQ